MEDLLLLDSESDGTLDLEAGRRLVSSALQICQRVVVSDSWEDGPALPVECDEFSVRDLAIIESSCGTAGDIEACLCQLFPVLQSIDVATCRPGGVEITAFAREGDPIEEGLEARIELALDLLLSRPHGELKVCVQTGASSGGEEEEEDTKDSRLALFKEIFTSMSLPVGIRDPQVRDWHDEDEEAFLQAWERVFPLSSREDAGESSVLLPADLECVDLRALLPVFEKLYFVLPPAWLTSPPERYCGVTFCELLELSADGRCIPVLSGRWGQYNAKELREIREKAMTVVTPRQLSIRLSEEALSANPIWRIGQEDPRLARNLIGELRKLLNESAVDSDHEVTRIFEAWCEVQREGCVSLGRVILNQGSRMPLLLGVGMLAAQLLPPSQRPSLELILQGAGTRVAYAQALKATCFPEPGEGSFRIQQWLCALANQKPISSVEELAVVSELEAILQGIKITCPRDVSAREWAAILSRERVSELRKKLGKLLADYHSGTREDVLEAASELARAIEECSTERADAGEWRSTWDFFGLGLDVAAYSAGVGFVGAGWMAGRMLKCGSEAMWNRWKESPTCRDGISLLESMVAGGNPTMVGLCRLRDEVHGDVRAKLGL